MPGERGEHPLVDDRPMALKQWCEEAREAQESPQYSL